MWSHRCLGPAGGGDGGGQGSVGQQGGGGEGDVCQETGRGPAQDVGWRFFEFLNFS